MSELPAQPILASTLYAQTQSHARIHTSPLHIIPNQQRQQGNAGDTPQGDEKRPRLCTGCKVVDEGALRGGLIYGEGGVVTVAAADEAGGELILNFLATHLLTNPHPNSHAFYIDTLGTFSPAPLLRLLCARLFAPQFLHNGGYVYSRNPETGGSAVEKDRTALGGDADVQRQAMQMLEKVSIMKVFDWTGLVEAVAECGEVLEGGTRAGMREDVLKVVAVEERLHENGEDGVSTDKTEKAADRQEPTPEKVEIVDSEDEDEDDEMLESPNAATRDAHVLPQSAPSPNPQPSTSPPQHREPNPSPPQPSLHPTLLILSHLPRLLNPLMHSNHILGHALLVNLTRSLRHLTASHPLCVLVGNAVVGLNPNPNPFPYTSPHDGRSSTSTSTTNAANAKPADGRRREDVGRAPDSPSVFAGVSGRPALGRTWPFLVDVSLLVSRVRRGRGSSRVGREELGGRGTGTGAGEGLGEEQEDGMVDVVEVLADRCEGRVGRWAAFERGDGGDGGLRGLEM